MTSKTSDWRPGPTVCRCCLSEGCYKDISTEYFWMGKREVYAEMLTDILSVSIAFSNSSGPNSNSRLICEACITRLRDASDFRRQVLECEKTFMQQLEPGSTSMQSKLQLALQEVKIEWVKQEKKVSDDEDFDDRVDFVVKNDDDDDDDNDDLESISADPPQPGPKILEAEQKTYANTITIVENSYVCPFTTSFTDYFCIYCRHTFTDPSKLREHTLEHDPMTFKTINGNKKFAQIDILRVDCRLCPAQIDDIDTLKDHLQRAHEKLLYPVTNEFLKFKLTLTNLTCTECNADSFKYFHALKKHMADHFGTCICDVCGAHYFEERVLVKHQKTHQKTSEEVPPCKDCGKTFKSSRNRYLHEAKFHKKEAAHPSHLKNMKHQCDLCDRRFYLPSRLKEHMSTHTGERNYRCEYCGKSYPRLRGLKVHMQSHSAEKRFTCMLCNASFTQNVNLKNHMKRQHQSIDINDSYHSVV